jgi:UDP-N-acetylglucosamine--N-acetylmuramyl-(pentapeptide) pyrophosphoryl-undecaprenol N-acetylglucosamine transferase
LKEIRILVTGGGTGGHVGPALAVVQTLQQRAAQPGADFEPIFLYMGSETALEAKMAREAGLPFVGVATGKLRRSARGFRRFWRQNLADLFRLPLGLVESLNHVRRFKPDVVFSTGGYVSVPPVVAAGLLRLPILTHEQTVTVGLANRIAGRFATRIALAFDNALQELPPPRRRKAFVTGNPIRAAVFDGDRARAARRFGFAPEDDGKVPCLYVTGGAQGARIINRAVEAALPELLTFTRVLAQCGQQKTPDGSALAPEQDYDRLTAKANDLSLRLRQRVHVTRFIERDAIGDAYALADLVAARSGAGTVTEVCALGKPALFIPLYPTSGDEQTKNAQRLVDVGAAALLREAECDGPRLIAEVRPLLSDPARLEAMGKAALTLARPHAADELADALLALAQVRH